MAILNGYTTLAAVKDLLNIEQYDAVDDAVLNDLINKVSRFIDSPKGTGRLFYPRIETRLYDCPDNRTLYLDDDLLAVITVTNGDASVILPAEYLLEPANVYPKYAIRIKESSSYYWTVDDNANSEQVISIAAWWGFRQYYTTRGWALGSTVVEVGNLNATDTTFTTASGSLFSPGQIIKINDELMNVSGVAAADLSVTSRGDNGSTAATHINGSSIYIWMPEDDIQLACQSIVKNLFHNRGGQNTDGVATITGAGVVITPRDIPALTLEILKNYRRIS